MASRIQVRFFDMLVPKMFVPLDLGGGTVVHHDPVYHSYISGFKKKHTHTNTTEPKFISIDVYHSLPIFF
jgi:hypothetical protein